LPHTLLRPRDLMTIGERLARSGPRSVGTSTVSKEGVNQAAAEIAYEYLAEIAPHLGDLELDRFLRRLPGHILTRAEVELPVSGRRRRSGRDVCILRPCIASGARLRSPRSRSREAVQRFLRPGEATLEPDGVLPPATTVPVDDRRAIRISTDRGTSVGYAVPWPRNAARRRTTVCVDRLCVLKAEVHGFGTLMRSDEPDRPVTQGCSRQHAVGFERCFARSEKPLHAPANAIGGERAEQPDAIQGAECIRPSTPPSPS